MLLYAGIIAAGSATKVMIDEFADDVLPDILEKPRTIDIVFGIIVPLIVSRKAKSPEIAAGAVHFSWGYVATIISDDLINIATADEPSSAVRSLPIRIAIGSGFALATAFAARKFMPALSPSHIAKSLSQNGGSVGSSNGGRLSMQEKIKNWNYAKS